MKRSLSATIRYRRDPMALILRILIAITVPITALFVARDTLNFTIIQAFIVMLVVVLALLAAAMWQYYRQP